jgi:hypothetical protein
MDTRTGTIEDLPPLELCELRELDLDQPPAEGRPAHVSSASGVIRRGDHVYVIGDDLLALAVYRMSRPGPGTLARVLEGELPVDEGERKAAKPDLEALTGLPPFERNPFGALFGLGSGSGPGRDRGFVWALAADGGLRGGPAEVDLSPVYDLLRDEVGSLNVEGACVVGDCLWLLNRGNDPGSRNAVAELSLREVMASLHGDLRLDARELESIAAYDLGELEGVPLAFSDGTPLASDVLVFTASAEADDDDGPDGEIRGSVVGTITPEGKVHRLRTIDRRFKVEGVHATIDTGVVDLLFVCDQDDPDVVSPLLSAAMPLDPAFEG